MCVSRPVLGLVVTVALATPRVSGTQDTLSSLEQRAIGAVRADTVRDVTTALAAAAMEGRGAAQAGGERAAAYLAGRFATAGLKPGAGSSSYYQRIDVNVDTLMPDTAFSVGSDQFAFKKDFAVAQPSSPSAMRPVTADVVFVGYGVVSAGLNRDDLAGVDVSHKIVIVLSGIPRGVDPDLWEKESKQRVVFGRLIDRHAAGFIVVDDGDASAFESTAAAISNRTVRPSRPLVDATAASRWSLELLADRFDLPPSVLVSQRAANVILRGRLADLKRRADARESITQDLMVRGSIAPHVSRQTGTTSNVIGVVEGSDVRLAREAVVFTAHYDGFGKDSEGVVYAGAGDNALGVGKLVAVAEALAGMTPRPRRSVIFIATTGEEYGDLGAAYWLEHPTWPIATVAADINYDCSIPLDAFGRLAFVFDFGFAQSDLNDTVKRVAAATGVAIEPDPDPEGGLASRSDQYVFMKAGTPALLLVGGPAMGPRVLRRAGDWENTRYHKPTDVVEADWNWDGPRMLAAFGLVAGLRIANQDLMPAWKPGSPYKRKTF
jgi:hypothetical protein